MNLRSVELFALDLALVRTVQSGAGEHRRRPLVLIHLETDEAEGWGECAALAEPTYTGEFAAGAMTVLAEHLIPRLVARGTEIASVTDAMTRLAPLRGHPMATAALEMALLDAQLRVQQQSLASYLGATRDSVPAGATIGAMAPDLLVEQVGQALAAGYEKVKIKIVPEFDLVGLRAVRSAYPQLELAADANGSYDVADRAHLHVFDALEELELAYLEQPLAADDLVGHAQLVEHLSTPIVLDESITSLGDLESAIALRALGGVSVKGPRVGGLLAARALSERARDAGLHSCVGGMFESGLGRAAALSLAALEGFDWTGDLGGSERYFVDELTAPLRVVDGRLRVPSGPGLGVEPARDVLAAVTRRVIAVPLSNESRG